TEDGAGGGRVDEGSSDAACAGIQLRRAEGGAVGDGGRSGPGDRGLRLVDRNLHRLRGRVVVGGVGGGEGRRERLIRTGTEDSAGCGRVDEGSGDAARAGIQL